MEPSVSLGFQFFPHGGSALRAASMRDVEVRMLAAVVFQPVPEPAVIADLLAVGTDGDEPRQGLHQSDGKTLKG